MNTILRIVFRVEKPYGVIHMAAESHVDRSIISARPFVHTNVEGTRVLLDCARKHDVHKFLYMSTDEVYGDLDFDDPPFTENHHLRPSSPYSASKAAGGLLVQAYHRTHSMHSIITRCSNNYGPYQFPEKFIPLMITNAIEGKDLPVYGSGRNVRDWIYVEDHCKGVLKAFENGVAGESYNFGGDAERHNIDVAGKIIENISTSSQIKFVTDRPGHDLRYAIDYQKANVGLCWNPTVTFENGLNKTIEWYKNNEDWWCNLKQ